MAARVGRRTEVGSRTDPSYKEALRRIASQLREMLCSPFQRIVGIIYRNRERVFRSQPIIDSHCNPSQVRKLLAKHRFVVQAAQAETPSMIYHEYGTAIFWRRFRAVDSDSCGAAIAHLYLLIFLDVCYIALRGVLIVQLFLYRSQTLSKRDNIGARIKAFHRR
jgi:hypothetical protein